MRAGAQQVDHLKAENERLRAELDLHKSALRHMPQGVAMFDQDGRLAVCNDRYAETLGLPVEEVLPGVTGRELLDLGIAAGQYDAQTADELEAELHEKIANGQRMQLMRGDATYAVEHRLTDDGYVVATFDEITAQLAAERTLSESEEHYRHTVELNPQIPWSTKPNGTPLSISPRWAQIIGCSPEDVREDPWSSFIHPDDRDRLQEQWLSALATGQLLEARARFQTLDGSYRWFRTRAAPRRNENQEIIRWYGTSEDVHEKVIAEEQLRKSEARLSAIINALPDCVKIFDEAGQIFHINPAGLVLLEAQNVEDLSKPGYSPVPPEHMETCIATHERVLSGEAVVWNYEIVGLSGRRRHVEAHSVPFHLPDGSRAHLCISRDTTERKRVEDTLRQSEERLQLVQETTGLSHTETIGDQSFCSERYIEQVGLPPRETISTQELLDLIHPEDLQRIQVEVQRGIAKEETFQCECRIIRPDNGEVRWISSRNKVERDEAGELIRIVGAHLDITERKRAEEALRESEERFRLAAEAAGLGVWDYDIASDTREWSDRLREILGISPEREATLELALECIHPDDRIRFVKTLRDLRDGSDAGRFDASFRIRRASDSSERWVTLNGWKTGKSGTRTSRIIMTARDVTNEKTAQERIRWSANHDPLTGLANRTLFQETLDLAIASAARSESAVGLLLLDIDHFKQINDGLGHDAGDMLLKMFAQRLQALVRADDTVARLGGDEFAILLPELQDEASLTRKAHAILERLREPFVHAGRVLDCRASVGASIFPSLGNTAEELLKNADMALYAAKSAGRATSALFEPEMRAELQRRSSMIQLARDAIHSDRVVPYYQPKLDLVSGSITGFEALLRWRDEKGRIQLPCTVKAAFEDLDAAAAISDRMIERTIADMRGWLDRGVEFGHVALNAAAAEFRRNDFAERVLDQLQRSDVPIRHFQLEVTETVFLGRGAENVQRALALLSANGVKIALDDFGTGYASLRHLKQFPVDIIKIDRSFVSNMLDDSGDEAIVRAVINLGRSLGIKVVAEGIETPGQAERLIQLGCDFGQGFLFSKAVPASRLPSFIGRWRADAPAAKLQKFCAGLRLVSNRN